MLDRLAFSQGKEINPHIPEFMARAPWYLNQAAPGLKHQKNSKPAEQKAGLDQWYARTRRAGWWQGVPRAWRAGLFGSTWLDHGWMRALTPLAR